MKKTRKIFGYFKNYVYLCIVKLNKFRYAKNL